MRSDEYYNKYSGILNDLTRAFHDVFLLKTIEEVQSKNELDNSLRSFPVMNHFCELAKADLGLTIYKILFDNSKPTTNTIKHFNSTGKKLGSQKNVKFNLSKETENLEVPLKSLRDTYLAHSDVNSTEAIVETVDLINATYEILDLINKMADNNIDDRVNPVTQNALLKIEHDFIAGTKLLMNTIIKKENGDNKNV